MRVQLPYADQDAFIKAYAINVSAAGMFIAAEAPPAVGATVRFEVVLADQKPILRAEGEVVFSATLEDRLSGYLGEKPPSLSDLLSGFSVRFTHLDAAGRSLIAQVLAHKAAHPDQFSSAVPQPYPPQPAAAAEPPPRRAPAARSGAKPGPSQGPGPGPEAEEAEEAALTALLQPAVVPAPPAADAARLLDELLGRRPG
jgi:uncharacterized protein (TIGR02266 family)